MIRFCNEQSSKSFQQAHCVAYRVGQRLLALLYHFFLPCTGLPPSFPSSNLAFNSLHTMVAYLCRILAAICLTTIFLFSVPTSSTQLFTAYRISHYDSMVGIYSGGPGTARPSARYCPGSFVYNNEFWLYGGYGNADGSKYWCLYSLSKVVTFVYFSFIRDYW
jgi:hypothetical protein